MRKKGAEGERAPRTRRGPRPLPEQQPGTSPPSSTPAKRRRTPIEQLLRGGGRGIAVTPAARAARPGPPGGPSTARPGGGLHTPRPCPPGQGLGAARTPAPPRGPQRRTPKDGRPARARPERERGAAEAGSSPQASGRRLPSARPPAAGPARTPAGPPRRRSPSSRLHS